MKQEETSRQEPGHALEIHILQIGALQGCARKVRLREVGASQISLCTAFRTSFLAQSPSKRCSGHRFLMVFGMRQAL